MPGGEIRLEQFSSKAYQFSIYKSSRVSYTSLVFRKRKQQMVWRTTLALCRRGWEWLWNAHGNKNGPYNVFQHQATETLRIGVLAKPMRTPAQSNVTYVNFSKAKNKGCWLHANWKQVYVSGHQGKYALVAPMSQLLSLLRMLDKCYDRVLIFFERSTKFVDPITRQTHVFGSEVPFLGGDTNVFQPDLENCNSWYDFLLDPIPF